ncbi:MAG: ATP synthase F1 subunit delta [SAR324 cluster bacterium]|nr:ATP synthase F1 subunit delta [SAR324 cluster bacterium]MBF0350531.1 ATP synthase F1 subunit delta [SAR324 cluster bacterium]
MSQFVVAKRYAKALVSLVDTEKELEELGNALTEIAQIYGESTELQHVMIDTKISTQIKNQILVDVMKKQKINAVVQNFVQYLLSKRRIVLLPDIQSAFSRLVMEKLGRLEAEVTVAEELSKSALKELESQLSRYSGKTVSVVQKTDPSIIGGVVTRLGSVIIDGSIRNQLNSVRQSISRG